MWTKEKFTDPKQNFWTDLHVGDSRSMLTIPFEPVEYLIAHFFSFFVALVTYMCTYVKYFCKGQLPFT